MARGREGKSSSIWVFLSKFRKVASADMARFKLISALRNVFRAFTLSSFSVNRSACEMEAIFYAAGPSFRQGVTLPAMANLNLYLIIARLLEIQPAPNDGDSTTVEKLFR